MEESHPEEPLIHSITPQHIFVSVGTFATLLFCLIFGVVFFTPIGTLLLGQEGLDMVENIQRLNERVASLRDSVDFRDRQLRSIKNIIVKGKDTTFNVNTNLLAGSSNLPDEGIIDEEEETPIPAERVLTLPGDDENEIITADSAITDETLTDWGTMMYNFFPVEPPVVGRYSREFSLDKNHFGLDIAAEDGSTVRSIADGMVVVAEWTFNYGYVIYIQHQGGWISGFKHCTSLSRKAGDIVAARDIIGSVGDSGLISSGPHLHLELWHNGIPVDPAKFLIK